MSSTSPGPPPEAALIRRSREASGISPEAAAARIKIKLSGRRWRQLEAGEESPGGTKATMSDAQLAHMASVVGVRPERLEAIGKIEAAAILRTIEDMRSTPAEPAREPTLAEVMARMDQLTAEIAELRRQRDAERDERVERREGEQAG